MLAEITIMFPVEDFSNNFSPTVDTFLGSEQRSKINYVILIRQCNPWITFRPTDLQKKTCLLLKYSTTGIYDICSKYLLSAPSKLLMGL